jgi:[amino group carrier protein]-lysine/ornithine hydrolase
MSVELLVNLLRCYSPSQQEENAVITLVEWMREHGFRAWIDEVGNACGIRGDENAQHSLMLLGHIDTVTGDIETRIDGDVLYGRGAVDAKGPLSAFASAAAEASIPEGWRVVVIGAVEEEIATSRGAHHVRDYFNPDLCIIGEPSGTAQITLGYKGRLLVHFSLTCPRSHTARPEPSVSARGVHFWQDVLEWSEQINEGRTGYFARVMPHLLSINSESDGFFETVRLSISLRLPPDWTLPTVRAIVSARAPADACLEFSNGEEAYLSDKHNSLVRGMLSAIRAQKLTPGFVIKTGTSDMNVIGAAWKCPIIAYGPGDSNLDHSPNEHISLTEYEQAIAVLANFIEGLGTLRQ